MRWYLRKYFERKERLLERGTPKLSVLPLLEFFFVIPLLVSLSSGLLLSYVTGSPDFFYVFIAISVIISALSLAASIFGYL